ncbi:MAG: SpoIID/LytB domain-containing protein [Candidatus Gastranaerophilaceae bacterium]|jgi:stage II sporulation protein D
MKNWKKSLILILFILFIIPEKSAFAIKIGLYDNIMQNYVAVSNNGVILNGETNQSIVTIRPMSKYILQKYKNKIAVSINNRFYDLGTDKIIIQSGSSGFISTKNKWYRGNLLVVNNGQGLTFINDVPLEYYLLGVVPSEMPSRWNTEAHKAQAIAARSYALANLGKRANKGYDLTDTPADQAYGGASSETQKTNNAVIETQGLVMTYNNKIIPAYYHSSSGGHTLNSAEVWNKNLPFIHSVTSYDNNVPKNGHGIGMSQYGANNLANNGFSAYQILGYFYNNINFNRINTDL